MKKILSLALTILCLGSVFTSSVAAVYEEELASNRSGYTTTIISGEEIRQYLEDCGEEYDPNLVEVIRIEVDPTHSERVEPDNGISPNFIFFRDPIAKNVSTRKYTDFSDTLAEFLREAGEVSIDETVTISNSFTADAGINAEVLEMTLGIDVTRTDEFAVKWNRTYSYPVRITVYPRYEETTGEIWDQDIQFDDYIGDFTVLEAIGDDIRVYRR